VISKTRSLIVLFLTLALLGFAPGSYASEPGVLYSQLDNGTGVSLAGGNQPLAFIADDFTVPTGEQWTVTQFSFPFSLLVGGFDTYSVAVFGAKALDPTLPGDQISLQSLALAQIAIAGGVATMTLPEPVTLQSGIHWIGVDGFFLNVRTSPIGQHAVRGIAGNFELLAGSVINQPVDLRFTLIGTAQPVATPAALVEQFDELAANGTLTAAGPGKSAASRFTALRSMLVTASALYDSGDVAGACDQLGSAAQRIHTQGQITSSHFASGTSATEMLSAIDSVRATLCT
jgi:hypothetical protein